MEKTMKSLGATTFLLPAPVLLVGSYDQQGKANIMTAAWGGICASQPPAVAVSIQRSRWTYTSLLERKAFTISVPSTAQAAQADFAGIRSGSTTDKFASLHWSAVKGDYVDAPYVGECPLVLELVLLQHVEIGSHVQFIGEVKDVKVRADCLDAEGRPDVAAIDPLLFAPVVRQYWGLGKVVGKAFSLGRSIG